MEIISPCGNGGRIELDALRERATDRQLPAALEQRRDDGGRYAGWHDVPSTNRAVPAPPGTVVKEEGLEAE